MLQHAQFVAAGDAQLLGQVATGDLFHRQQRFAQRAGDLPGDQHRAQHADQQRQQRGDGLQAAGLAAFDVATLQLDLVQRIAALDDIGTLYGHFRTRGGDAGDRIAELAYGITVGPYRAFQLLQACAFTRHLAFEVVDIGQCCIQLAQGGLLVAGTVVGNVAAHVDAHLQQLLARLADQLVLGQAHAVGFRAGHDFLAEQVHGLVGAGGRAVHGATRCARGVVALAHLVQRQLVGADGFPQLTQQLDVLGAFEGTGQVGLLLAEGVQLGLGVGGRGIVAIGDHVLQAGHAQVGQVFVQLADVAHPVATVDQAAQAGPASQGQQAGEDKHQAEAQAQFEVDADVGKPAVHARTPEIVFALLMFDRQALLFWMPADSCRGYRQCCGKLKRFFSKKKRAGFCRRGLAGAPDRWERAAKRPQGSSGDAAACWRGIRGYGH